MKSWIKELCAITVIVLCGFLLLLPLFFPQQQILVTPDFSRSDALDSSFSTKYILSEALKSNTLPLWTQKLGNGFPLIGEGQIGAFFLPNIIVFKLFPVTVAYNLSLFLAVISIGVGTYFWLRVSGNTRLASLFGAITISLSGPVVSHLTHISLLQSFSLMPWVMFATHQLARKPTARNIGIFALFASSQLLTGSPQPAFLTGLFAATYYGYLIWKGDKVLKRLVVFLLAYCLTILLSSVQLLPSREFLEQTAYPKGAPLPQAAMYQFPIDHLLTYLHPFFLGNPRDGSYYQQERSSTSIFWENNGYIGLLPLVFIGIAFFINRKSLYFWGGAGVITFLFMLGMNSPLYIIYSIWPFSLFHVPSRFIWILTFIIVMTTARTLSYIITRLQTKILTVNTVILLVIFAQCVDLLSSSSPYHLFGKPQEWLNSPMLTEYIQTDSSVLSYNTDQTYHSLFIKGWQDSAPYSFLLNGVTPNTSAIWGISNFDVVSGRGLWRHTITKSLLENEFVSGENIATISATGNKLLRLYRIGTVVSSMPLQNNYLLETAKLTLSSQISLYVYPNKDIVPRAYFASNSMTAKTVKQALSAIQSEDFIPGKTILLEQPFTIPVTSSQGTITILEDSETKLHLKITDNPNTTYLVVATAYYPGWVATIDNKKTPIFPANINQQAIRVPKGSHSIMFEYTPLTVWVGAIITGLSLILVIGLMVFRLPLKLFDTHRKISSPRPGRRHNHDT